MEIPCSNEVVGRHIDIAAAGGKVRYLYIIDGTAGVAIHDIAILIILRKPKTYHLVLDSSALRDIGRHHFGAAIRVVVSVIGGNQFVQFLQAFAQRISVVKGTLFNTSQHPLVGQVDLSIGSVRIISIAIPVLRNIRIFQPVRHTAFDVYIDGIGSTGDQGAGDIDRAGFWQCLIRRHCVGGQECLVGAGAAQSPVPEALVFGDPFLAGAGDDVDVLVGAHHAADVHRPHVLADVFIVIVFVIFYPGSGNGNYGVVVRAGLQIRFQVGQGSFFVGARVQAYIAAAFNSTRHRHIAGAVRNNDVFGHNGADNPGINRAVHLGFHGQVVIGGNGDILCRGRLFIAENRAALHVDIIMDIKNELADSIGDSDCAAALSFYKVRQVVLGGRDVFLQMVGSDLRVGANGNRTVFDNINQTAQPVAGNDAAKMILHGEGLGVRSALFVRIVISAGGNGIGRTDMGPVSGDYRAVCHIGVGIGSDIVIHAGAAYARNAAVAFRSRQAGLVLLGGNEPYVACGLPLAAECAGNVVNGVVPHMGANITHKTAAARVGKGLALVLAIGSYGQGVQLVGVSCRPSSEGSIQGLLAEDVRAGIAHSHGACSDAVDIGFAVHIGFVI